MTVYLCHCFSEIHFLLIHLTDKIDFDFCMYKVDCVVLV